jgi:hypothetical protein
LDAFRVRYADAQDIPSNKTFRSVLKVEEESVGSQLDM